MSTGFYLPRNGFFEKLHPVTKLWALLFTFIPPFVGNSLQEIIWFMAWLIIASLAAGAWPNLARTRNIMLILTIMSILIWLFFAPGKTILVRIGPVTIMRESLMYGLTVALRLNCFIFSALTFLTSTPIEDFTYALRKTGLPYGPSFALSLAFRLTPLFMETASDIALAQKARGLDLDQGNFLTRLRRHAPIIVPVLVSGLRKGDQLAVALESRGFGRGGKRTSIAEHSFSWRDPALVLVLAAIFLPMLYF